MVALITGFVCCNPWIPNKQSTQRESSIDGCKGHISLYLVWFETDSCNIVAFLM